MRLLLSACQTAENVGRDAEETPIGSVITGETTTANSYIKKVSERNKSLDRILGARKVRSVFKF
ncbi:MAG: hypothetical protein ACLUKN_06010 [Bacilli bacterium]